MVVDSKKVALLPFNRRLIKDKYFVSNFLGAWDFLSKEEFNSLNSFRFRNDSSLTRRLYERGLLADENNLKHLLDRYRALNDNLFRDTSLHISVITTDCNLACKYCQAKTQPAHMGVDVAAHVLKCLFEVKNTKVTLELQGGEPLLNWDTCKFLVENARKINRGIKDLKIALVTNLTLLDHEKARFFVDHGVEICVSFDGPRFIHDQNRVFPGQKGSYDAVIKNIKMLETEFQTRVNLLPTITKRSLPHAKDIIDEYLRQGQSDIALRPVNELGNACINWDNLGYSAEEFTEFYQNAFEYILSLNKKGVFFRERMASVILQKVLNGSDAGYVDMMNPCGAGRGQIAYMPDGRCFPCDEARILGDEAFVLGNIAEKSYQELMGSENLLHLLEASVMNLWDADSAFLPWIGTCPVLNYSLQNNFVPKIRCAYVHKIYDFQFEYILSKMLESEQNLEIFKGWIEEKGGCHGKKTTTEKFQKDN